MIGPSAHPDRFPRTPKKEIQILPSAEDLAREAARIFSRRAQSCVVSEGKFRVLLSGGSTPKRMFEILAGKSNLPWDRIHLFWGDERMVPPNHPDSNFRMTQETLLSKVPIPLSNVHRIETESGVPSEAARQYDLELRREFGSDRPRFDLVFLGVGLDGHTASLFPGTSEADSVSGSWVVSSWVERLQTSRVSVALHVLNAAKEVVFLVSGKSKGVILHDILRGKESVNPTLPAAKVRPIQGKVLWLVDRDAARALES